ncbi:MAG: hypothetical protein V3T83_06340 [Acidobacteriota bacterium]
MRSAKLLVFVLLASLLGGVALGQKKLNTALLKQDARIFRGIVHEVLKQNFPHRFALEAEPLVTYLQGYGIVVSFELFINRPDLPTPFSKEFRSKEGKAAQPAKSKEEQVELVRQKMIACLADYGSAFKQLSSHDRIAISAHIEDRAEFNQASQRSVLVMSASMDDIQLLNMRRITSDQFQERVNVIRY